MPTQYQFDTEGETDGEWMKIRLSKISKSPVELRCASNTDSNYNHCNCSTVTIYNLPVVLKYVSRCFIVVHLSEQMSAITTSKYVTAIVKSISAVLFCQYNKWLNTAIRRVFYLLHSFCGKLLWFDFCWDYEVNHIDDIFRTFKAFTIIRVMLFKWSTMHFACIWYGSRMKCCGIFH